MIAQACNVHVTCFSQNKEETMPVSKKRTPSISEAAKVESLDHSLEIVNEVC